MIVKIADWTKFPGGKYKKYGPHSGEEFRRDYLMPSLARLAEGEVLVIDFTGVYSMAPSWIDEVFAEPIRRKLISYEDMVNKVKLKSDAENNIFISMTKDFIREADESIKADGVNQ